MENLLQYLSDHPAAVKLSQRANVALEPVKTATVGIVNKRSNGFGISNSTFDDKFELLRLVHEVAKDPTLAGSPPAFYTSVCINVNYTAALHVDRNNYGLSSAIAGGSFTGGRLFVAEKNGNECFRATLPISSASVDVKEGEVLPGEYFCIKNSWLTLDGSVPHGVEEIGPTCNRISLIYFCVPFDKVNAHTFACLAALGFPLPNFANLQLDHIPVRLTPLPPFTIFICSRSRSQGIQTDTLRVLLASKDDIISSAIVLCINEEEVADYQYLGFPMIVVDKQAGLPEQRQMCLRGRPAGAWNLFLDDDVVGFHNLYSPDMSLRQLFILCFLVCERERLNLFGLNTSMDARNLRANISRRLGLVNGYCFGIISDPDNPKLATSDRCGGAAEDIERSLRYYQKGILRFNFAAAIAKTRSNAGGLQSHYGSPQLRNAAHEYVIRSLMYEFPNLVGSNTHSPNAVTFHYQRQEDDQEGGDGDDDQDDQCHDEDDLLITIEQEETQMEDGGQHVKQKKRKRGGKAPKQYVSIAPPPTPEEIGVVDQSDSIIHKCTMCDKQYKRKEDLQHHVRVVHNSESIVRFSCRLCGRQFLKRKDALNHERGQRCNSRRGKHKPIYEKNGKEEVEENAPDEKESDEKESDEKVSTVMLRQKSDEAMSAPQ